MNNLEVEVTSKHIIKPSSPTPESLRHYQLSFLDQITPHIYNPLIFFYPAICDTQASETRTSDKLKLSIAESLTYFYPLAGRVRVRDNNINVHCNDEGIPFLEARVKCKLSDVITNPVPSQLNNLLPFDLYDEAEFLLGIQFNVFDCGGIGIAMCISHKIGDALSIFAFVNNWTAIARGDKNLIAPEFVSASLFPPRSISGFKPNNRQSKAKIITTRFVFAASKIEEIKEKYTDNNSSLKNPKRPTRVEALSAFIWERFVAATKVRLRPNTHCAIFHLVNIRTTMDPPLPNNSFGNLYSFATTIPSMDEGSSHNLATQIRDAITKLDGEYVKKIQSGQDHLDQMKKLSERAAKGEAIYFSFSSLCRFPLYEADFGWGKPVWVGSAARASSHAVVFMDTASGDGIEVWINLKEEDMANFDCDEELLAYIEPPAQ